MSSRLVEAGDRPCEWFRPVDGDQSAVETDRYRNGAATAAAQPLPILRQVGAMPADGSERSQLDPPASAGHLDTLPAGQRGVEDGAGEDLPISARPSPAEPA